VSEVERKKKVNITVDEVVWKKARIMGFNRSAICEEALRSATGMGNNEDQLVQREKELKHELGMTRRQLETVRSVKLFKEETGKKEETDIEFVMGSVFRFVDKFGYVGFDKIEYLCNKRQVDAKLILDECKKHNIRIENFQEMG
jgi:post-segregation antitoxin (ccd killing protein)